jgi:ribose transport system permease protein
MKNEISFQSEAAFVQEMPKNSVFKQFFKQYLVTFLLIVLILILTAVLTPEFFNLTNITNVVRQASIVGVVAMGMTFVILTGGIDLSVGAILAVSGVSFAIMLNHGLSVPIAILFVLLIGIVAGLINGIGSTFLGIQPFIMTLATMAIGDGVALLLSNGTPQSFNSNSKIVDFVGNGGIGPIPGPVILFALITIVSWISLKYLPFGRFVYGVGGSIDAARLSGVRTTRILLIVYAISGLCAAVAGIITASRLYVGHPTANSDINLDSIAAVVIGGTSLMGGKGGVGGTILGSLLLAMVANVLNLLGVSPYNQQVAKGIIIVAAVLFTMPSLKQHIKQQWTGL